MPKTVIRSWYSDVVIDSGVDFTGDVGYAKQEFKDECDINFIMSRYMNDGVMPAVQQGRYGDYTDVPSLLEAHAVVERSRNDFASLSSKVRERFGNDPVKLMVFLSDVSNRDEAISLGLIAKPVVVDVPAPPPQAAGGAGNNATP